MVSELCGGGAEAYKLEDFVDLVEADIEAQVLDVDKAVVFGSADEEPRDGGLGTGEVDDWYLGSAGHAGRFGEAGEAGRLAEEEMP